MPWSRNDPDPLKAKRRQLAEQARLLAEKMSRLAYELQHGTQPPPATKPAEPPVWRMEEDGTPRSGPEPAATRKRNLARQRRRDMFIFFLCMVLLLIATGFFIWLSKTHLRGED